MSVLAVLVVYERNLTSVEAWSTLRAWLDASDAGRSARHLDCLLIYDNSSVRRAVPASDIERCRYVHNPDNGGTAAAYTHAAVLASELGIEWLLLLDHDTRLPADFLEGVAARIGSGTGSAAAAALVPWVIHGARTIVSPTRVTRSGTFRPLRPGLAPSSGEHISAIASGTVLRVASLRMILPFPQGLWLDYVDHWIFAQLHRRGMQVALLDRWLQHDLSVASLRSLSASRLKSVLQAEAIFNTLLGELARLVYPWRLLWRVLRLAVVNPVLAAHALRWIAGSGLRNQ